MRKPTIPEVIPMVQAYYAMPGNMCGGNLHIVLDDGNVKDENVKFCIERAGNNGDATGEMLGKVLLSMSVTQRRKLSRMSFST